MEKAKRTATTPERLREAMQLVGKKQIDLAEETGLSHSTISRYLSGKVEPRQDAASKLAAALGVSEFWLWGYDVPRVRSEAQKKNDALVDVVKLARKDPDFLDVVTDLAGLSADHYATIKQLIAALRQK
jgi:transcriptional regulator with XRE-family HTH domain